MGQIYRLLEGLFQKIGEVGIQFYGPVDFGVGAFLVGAQVYHVLVALIGGQNVLEAALAMPEDTQGEIDAKVAAIDSAIKALEEADGIGAPETAAVNIFSGDRIYRIKA